MHRGRHKRRHDQRGAAAIEFAIIAPVLFMVVFGIIEFGIAWSEKNVFVGAAREGARFAAVACGDGSCVDGEVAQRVIDAAVGYDIDGAPGSITVTPNPGCSSADTSENVTVSFLQDFVIDIPFIPTITLNDVEIEAVFRCEY
jgi:hypothetical protein